MMETDTRVSLLETCYKRADDQRTKDIAIPNPFTGAPVPNPWQFYDKLYRGDQWSLLSGLASWSSRPVKNAVFSAVESYTTMITDNNPSFTIMPAEEADEDLSEVVRAGVEKWWADEYMAMKTALTVKSSRICSIGWFYGPFKGEDGRQHVKVVHPESVLVDPDCTVEEFDPAYVIYEYRAQWGDVRKQWPNTDWTAFHPDYRIGKGQRVQYDRYEQNYNPAKSVVVYQFWQRDPERVIWEDEKELPGFAVKKSKKKFPKGRVTTIAGGVILKDKDGNEADIENPYSHGQFPFTPVHAYPVPGRFYGIGDVQNALNPQLIRNRFAQMIVDQTLKAGGFKVFLGQPNHGAMDSISNAPVEIVPVRDVSQVRFESVNPPSRHLVDYMNQLDNDINDMVGLHEVSQGARTPGNPVTAQEISILAESDRTRVRMASRWLNWALERVGRQLLSNWAQFGDFKWIVQVAGEDDNGERAVGTTTFDPKVLKLDKDKVAYDLKVVDSSTLPASRQEQVQKVQMLLSMGVITPEHVLKYKMLDIPHADEILADMQAMQAQAPPMDVPPAGMPPDAAGPEMMPPEQMPMDPTMMAAMSPVPPGMGEDELMAAVQMMADQQGVSPEQVLAAIMGGGESAVLE